MPDNLNEALTDRDRVFLADEEWEVHRNLLGSVYYLNGEIIQKNIVDEESPENTELLESYEALKQSVNNEQHIFMDNIINGMSLEDATKLSKENRQKFKMLEDEIEQYRENREEKFKQKILEKFKKEEAGINYKYFLSILTIVRDENDYIEEWIRYHIEDLGFDHFYIYDNESAVPVKDYLESVKFEHLNKITFIPWKTSKSSQHDSHMDFLKNFRDETKWIFTADPDEYVIVKDKNKTLKEFLAENDEYSAIECIWHHFNANGQEKKTAGTDIERFTTEVDWYYGKDHGKRFAQTNRVKDFINYNVTTRFNTKIAAADPEDESWKISDAFFQLNHYYTRSYEEWLIKISRGTVVPYSRRKYSEFFELNPDMKYLDKGEDYKQMYGSPDSLQEK